MIYARQPNDVEALKLQHQIRVETGRVNTRARMILLSAQHYSTPALEELLGINQVTIRRWIRRFNEQGPAGLYDAPRPGRPRKSRMQPRPQIRIQ